MTTADFHRAFVAGGVWSTLRRDGGYGDVKMIIGGDGTPVGVAVNVQGIRCRIAVHPDEPPQ